MCSNPDNLQTDDQKDEVGNGLASSTAGGSNFNPESIKKILAMLKFLLNQQSQSQRRRRRSSTPKEVTEKTPEQVHVVSEMLSSLQSIVKASYFNLCTRQISKTS